ncbi:oxidoreductase [Mesorhizobium sp. 131-3-5]|uniref:Gfo/Idh/MocA family protein n=1 Tax=Mesorhizobium sp. 131-3-5 TaxID=2744520 RepID=UPI001937CF23|nr:Gfo/Idh/MocA family oxidoreductase [Mesorhizobium sp. 131-3-5]BCH08405.1 oxidoreductase [Mesorhizobium sp. 131-3-5]
MATGTKAGWSFMGTGTIATELMVEAIRSVDHSPLWVVSRSKTDAAYFAQDLGIPHATTDLAIVLEDPTVRFAYISARLQRRPHYISAAAGAGKHILCDGPISGTSKTAITLVRLCEESGALLAVNQRLRASTIHQTMRRLIVDGDIGAVQSIVLIRGGPYQAPPNRRARDFNEGSGIYLDVTVEDIDLARFLTGAEPVEVSALGTQDQKTPGHVAYLVRLHDGSLFQAHESFRTADIESMVLVAGDRGALIAQGTLNGRAGTLVRRIDGKSELVPVRDHDFSLATIREFVNSRGQEPSWLAQGVDSVIALRTAEAIVISAKRRRTVPIQA